MRQGLQFNPSAMAFVGLANVLRHENTAQNQRRLLELAVADAAGGRGFQVTAPILVRSTSVYRARSFAALSGPMFDCTATGIEQEKTSRSGSNASGALAGVDRCRAPMAFRRRRRARLARVFRGAPEPASQHQASRRDSGRARGANGRGRELHRPPRCSPLAARRAEACGCSPNGLVSKPYPGVCIVDWQG